LSELPEFDLKAKTGTCRNSMAGAIWQLSIQEGKLKVDVPNFSFQLSPLSPTEFIPVIAAIYLEFVFEKQKKMSDCLCRCRQKA